MSQNETVQPAARPQPGLEPNIVYTPTPGLAGKARRSLAISLLEKGEAGQARAELQAYLNEKPGDRISNNLLQQIETDPVALLGQKYYLHRMQPGESISIVADRELGDPLKFYALARYNGINNPRQIKAGQIIKVPGERPPGAEVISAADIPPPTPDEPAQDQGAASPEPAGAAYQASTENTAEPVAAPAPQEETAEFEPEPEPEAREEEVLQAGVAGEPSAPEAANGEPEADFAGAPETADTNPDAAAAAPAEESAAEPATATATEGMAEGLGEPEPEPEAAEPETQVALRSEGTESETPRDVMNTAQDFANLGDYPKAIAYLEDGLTRFPGHEIMSVLTAANYITYGSELGKSGQFPEAEASLRRASELAPGNPEISDFLNATRVEIEATKLVYAGRDAARQGEAEQDIDLMAQALSYFEEALKVQSDNPEAKREIETLRPMVIDSYDRDAKAAFRQQKLDEAVALWDKVLAIDPENQQAKLYRTQALDLKDRLDNLKTEE